MARITAEQKKRTRERIVASARELFRRSGFEQATTRDIAAAAGIAAGTLFNYFPSKEALALAIVCEALDAAQSAFEGRRGAGHGGHGGHGGYGGLEAELFEYIATGLRHLEADRPFVRDVLETAMSPFARPGRDDPAVELRLRHLGTVRELIAAAVSGGRSGDGLEWTPDLHLYWTLYLGVLAFWAEDDTPGQEATLAVLDQSVRLFVASLNVCAAGAGGPPSLDNVPGATPCHPPSPS